jgi:hypothetical protein
MNSFLQNLIPTKKIPSDFLVIEEGLERVTAGVFKPDNPRPPKLMGIGRKTGLTGNNFTELTVEALKTAEQVVGTLPKKVILGLSGEMSKTATIVARAKRQEPNKAITDEEIQEILQKSLTTQSPLSDIEQKDYKLYYSSVVWAHIDGARTVDPIGKKGTEIEVSCFHAFQKSSHLEMWDRFLSDSSLEIIKIIPTVFPLSNIIIRNGIQSLILLRVAAKKTEVTFIAETNIAEILTFDLGFENLDLWVKAVSIVFTEVKLPKGLPDVLWIYPEGKEEVSEKIRTKLLDIDWKKDFKREIPNVKLGQKPVGFSAEDTSVIALSMEGMQNG